MSDLDHVAIATTDIAATLGTLVGDLGATVFHGGDGDGFRWVQSRLGSATTGMTIESLVVWRTSGGTGYPMDETRVRARATAHFDRSTLFFRPDGW